MLRPSGTNPYDDALIEKICARAKFQADLKANRRRAHLTFAAATRKHA